MSTCGGDLEIAAVEFLTPGDVLRGLAGHALVKIAAVVDPPDNFQLFVRVREEPGALAADGMREEHFRCEARRGIPPSSSNFLKRRLTLFEAATCRSHRLKNRRR